LLTLSLIFSFGGDAPSLFGKNIYIVKTDAVEDLQPGTALITSKVPFEQITEGDIVVFQNSDNRAGIAEIVSTRYNDNVYGFSAISERGTEITLTQSQIVGKATHYSSFLGALISFVKSPAGVLVIAVIPCVIILIYEAAKSAFTSAGKGRREKEITPVKKQDEIPTYIPRQKMSAAISAYSKTEAIPDFSDFSDSKDDGYKDSYAEKLALRAETANEKRQKDIIEKDNYPLFKSPTSKSVNVNSAKSEKPRSAPLSQKRLNEAIAAVNAQKGVRSPGLAGLEDTGDFNTSDISQIVRTVQAEQSAQAKVSSEPITENVRQYMPKKSVGARISQTSAIPNLDRLLRDEDETDGENTRYNLEDILFSVDKKR